MVCIFIWFTYKKQKLKIHFSDWHFCDQLIRLGRKLHISLMLSEKYKLVLLPETKHSIPTVLNIITLTESHSMNILKNCNILWEQKLTETYHKIIIWPVNRGNKLLSSTQAQNTYHVSRWSRIYFFKCLQYNFWHFWSKRLQSIL